MRPTRLPKVKFAPASHVRAEHSKPLRDLLVRLPYLHATNDGGLDLLGSSPSLLLELAEDAECCVQALNLGIAAIGNILPYAAPEIEDGTVPMGTVEALGWLLAELGDVAAACGVLAAECRQARHSSAR